MIIKEDRLKRMMKRGQEKGKNIFVFVALSLLLTLCLSFFVSADLGLSLTASTTNDETDFHADTINGASTGVDGYDYSVSDGFDSNPDSGSTTPTLTSSVSGKSLTVDSWDTDTSTREIGLTYTSVTSGSALTIGWDDYDEDYTATIASCTDSGHSSCGSSRSLNAAGGSTSFAAGTVYLKLVVNKVSSSSGGGASDDDSTEESGSTSLFVLVVPVEVDITNGNEFRFIYLGDIGGVKVVESSGNTAVIKVLGTQTSLKIGQTKKFDVSGDGKSDISVKLISITDGKADFLVSPLETNIKLKADPPELAVSVIAGKQESREISITNDGADLDLEVELKGIDKYVTVDKEFKIKAGETKPLNLNILAEGKSIIVGKVIFKYADQEVAEVPVIISVKSENFLFDSAIVISQEFKKISAGKTLRTNINLKQVIEGSEKVDVVATYVIQDYEGNEYLKDSETFYVEGEKSYTKEFDTTELPDGKYIVGVEIVYPGAFATSTAQFSVSPSSWTKGKMGILFIILSAMIVILAVAVIWVKRVRKTKAGVKGKK